MILEEEKKVIAKVFGSEGDMTHKVNEYLLINIENFTRSTLNSRETSMLCFAMSCSVDANGLKSSELPLST